MKLTEKEKRILDLRFGLTDGRPLRLAQIARILGLSRQHIWEVEMKAMWKVSLFSGYLRIEDGSNTLLPSAVLKLRASLTDEERRILRQEWNIRPTLDASFAACPCAQQIKQVQMKALSMV